VPASTIAIAATADNRFDLLILMGRQPAVDREAIVGMTVPEVVHFATKQQSELPSGQIEDVK
jgi:hypothetical protein